MNKPIDPPTLLLCSCEGTMTVDGKAIGEALGLGPLPVHHQLCRSQIDRYETALQSGEALCVACTQEAPLFGEIAEEADKDQPTFFNIRELAGWAKSDRPATPKMAALSALASAGTSDTRTRPLASDGLCLVYGAGQAAFDLAAKLNRDLSVTLMLTEADDLLLPTVIDFPITTGTVAQADGHLGAFELTVDRYGAMSPASRAAPLFPKLQNGAKTNCSVIVDLSGDAPLFTGPDKRDGYLRADPKRTESLFEALHEASNLVGEFEKSIYVAYDPAICAHSRSAKVGCTKCLDHCPAGAITPEGEQVVFDTAICGGCGNCAAHCPTGAVEMVSVTRHERIEAIQTLAATYLKAGGTEPSLLLYEDGHGTELIGALARLGAGLPANVLPYAMHATSGAGHDTMLAAFLAGFRSITVLGDRRRMAEYDAVREEIALAEAMLNGFGLNADGRIRLAFEDDPDQLGALLREPSDHGEIAARRILPVGKKRDVTFTLIDGLAEAAPAMPAEPIALPATAPYGTVVVDTEGCTLCLACVSACPADALRDNPDRPQLSFVERNCVQCGICAKTCPESVISLSPRLNMDDAAQRPVVLYEEEPHACPRCGTEFAAKSSIEAIKSRLSGRHWMFETSERAALLDYCETCRLEVLSEGGKDPFAFASRPKTRTTGDYLKARDKGLTVDDFLIGD